MMVFSPRSDDVSGGNTRAEVPRRSSLHSKFARAMREGIDAFYESTEVLQAADIADGVAYMVTRPRHASISELWIMPTDQA
jgi:NADP-dependent 3-hydroxy acid dehydrogenase YdfG